MALGILSALSLGDDTTLGEGWLGQLVSLKYALVLWAITKNLETFFISDLKEISMMIR